MYANNFLIVNYILLKYLPDILHNPIIIFKNSY